MDRNDAETSTFVEYPRLCVSVEKIRENAAEVVRLAHGQNMSVFGVTKSTFGDPNVARAMLEGGCTGIADSRVENLERMKRAGVSGPFMLIRLPMMSQARRIVSVADISLNSEISVIRALSKEAVRQDKVHKVVLMIEMGDIREGVSKSEVSSTVEKVLQLPNIRLHGIGMNLACFGCVLPTKDKIAEFSDIVRNVEEEFSINLELITGGNSANIPMLLEGTHSGKFCAINSLRIGEGIVLGTDTTGGSTVPDSHQDAFTLEAEIVELREKSSIPRGTTTVNWCGEEMVFEDSGDHIRAILAVGRLDVDVDGLKPLDDNMVIEGGCSDVMVVSFSDGKCRYKVGDIVRLSVSSYTALASLGGSSAVTIVPE